MEKEAIITEAPPRYYALAVPRPLPLLSYASREALRPGMRVRVPLRQSEAVAMVWGEVPAPDFPVKDVLERLDDAPLLDAETLALWQFSARYYAHPPGLALESMLPAPLRQGKALPQPQELPALPRESIALTPAQRQALEALQAAPGVSLLQGVTGSGKSELYGARLREIIEAGGQALVLSPEIGLLPALFSILQKRTGARGAVYHSGLSPQKRAQIWAAAAAGQLDFILGTRSAVFLPLPRLAAIVVDEEHDLSYKQQEKFRYHARDLALWRGHRRSIPVILGTATPSLESHRRVQQGASQRIVLAERAHQMPLPRLVLDDGRSGRVGVLSMALLTAIRHCLQDGGQALLFLNRRGFASVLQCPHCSYRNECPHCDRLMTVHLRRQSMHCHHCQHRQALPLRCPQCQSSELELYGLGTERLEKTIQQQFPQARILRIDSDAYPSAKRFQEALERIRQGEIDLILGTQWLTKGHHFPRLRLVAVVDADQALHSADYRSEERLSQLLLQVGGRAGRESLPGCLWIQTRQPEHPVFQVLQQDYDATLRHLAQQREEALLPPYSAQALLLVQHRNAAVAGAILTEMQTRLRQQTADILCLGPVPAFLARRAGLHRMQLLLQASHKKILQSHLPALQEALWAAAQQRGATAAIDVDPQLMD